MQGTSQAPFSSFSFLCPSRYGNKDYCVWYDHLKPAHPTIHRQISEVLFNNERFTYKSKLPHHLEFSSIMLCHLCFLSYQIFIILHL